MPTMKFLDDFKPTRGLLSSYYVASMVSFFIFQLFPDFFYNIATWIVSASATLISFRIPDSATWYILFLVCFVFLLLLRRVVIHPLGFYINNEDAPGWELAILSFLILGFFIYLMNQSLPQPLPTAWPRSLMKLLGGYNNTINATATSLEEVNTWSIVPLIWGVGPIAFMYIRVLYVTKGAALEG